MNHGTLMSRAAVAVLVIAGSSARADEDPCPCGKKMFTIVSPSPGVEVFHWGAILGEENVGWANGEVVPVNQQTGQGEWNPVQSIDEEPWQHVRYVSICGASHDNRASNRAIVIRTRGFLGKNDSGTSPWTTLESNFGLIEGDEDFCRYSWNHGGQNHFTFESLPESHGVRYNYKWSVTGITGNSPISMRRETDQTWNGVEGLRAETLTTSGPFNSNRLLQPFRFNVHLAVEDYASNCYPVPGGDRLGKDDETDSPTYNPKLRTTVPVIIYPRTVFPDACDEAWTGMNRQVRYATTLAGAFINFREGIQPESDAFGARHFVELQGDFHAEYRWSQVRSARFVPDLLNGVLACGEAFDGEVSAEIATSVSLNAEIGMKVGKGIEWTGGLGSEISQTRGQSVTYPISVPAHEYIGCSSFQLSRSLRCRSRARLAVEENGRLLRDLLHPSSMALTWSCLTNPPCS